MIQLFAHWALEAMDAAGTNDIHIGDEWLTRFECERVLGMQEEREGPEK